MNLITYAKSLSLHNTIMPATLNNHNGLVKILSENRVIMQFVQYLHVADFLNLMIVSRPVRSAITRHSSPGASEMLSTQHVLVLLSRTRCKSSHKAPVRIGVRECVWCGDSICKGCDVAPYLPFSHRLRRLCEDCYAVNAVQKTKRGSKFCACHPGDKAVCPECPWQWQEESGLPGVNPGTLVQSCWVCERETGIAGCGWFCLWCERGLYGEATGEA
ncbi:Protein of unknown function [Pyronema omphalodes CBS 100304]|uniref:Uncharacterized protein n=1 Tax=Pyronema omphalodes (strain CBS 100304) TaxID=1076935 RepID=U4KVK1_PYROM|nr:Protein of unknown function [Pyronema omphalodes CBS 100304]